MGYEGNWGKLSRRVFAATALAVAIGAAAPAIAQDKEVVIVASGGALGAAFKENFFDPFTKETGIAVRFVPAADAEMLAKVKAMHQAGRVEWDLVSANLDQIVAYQDFFDKLDCGAIPNVAAEGIPGACDGYSILKQLDGHLLAFSTKAFPPGSKQPKTWADFWNVKDFPGSRSLPDHGTPWVPIAAALMADGVPPSEIKVPLDVTRALKKLDEIKPHVKVWWKTGDQSQQIVKDGEIAMVMMYSGRALRSKSQSVPIEVSWNQAIMAPGRWTMVKNAPHKQAALQFLNYFLSRPEAHVNFTHQIFYDTANRKSLDLLPVEERPNSALYGDNLQKALSLDVDLATWLGPNHDKLLEQWNSWIAK